MDQLQLMQARLSQHSDLLDPPWSSRYRHGEVGPDICWSRLEVELDLARARCSCLSMADNGESRFLTRKMVLCKLANRRSRGKERRNIEQESFEDIVQYEDWPLGNADRTNGID